MAIRKVYTSENQELEITWSEKGIHLYIDSPGQHCKEFIIEPGDIDDALNDMQLFADFVYGQNVVVDK